MGSLSDACSSVGTMYSTVTHNLSVLIDSRGVDAIVNVLEELKKKGTFLCEL